MLISSGKNGSISPEASLFCLHETFQDTHSLIYINNALLGILDFFFLFVNMLICSSESSIGGAKCWQAFPLGRALSTRSSRPPVQHVRWKQLTDDTSFQINPIFPSVGQSVIQASCFPSLIQMKQASCRWIVL